MSYGSVGDHTLRSFEQSTNDFLTWFSRNGSSISNKIHLGDLRHKSAGRGVVAIEDIQEDEELFTIPHTSILTTETSDLPGHVSSEVQDSWLALILAMIYEFRRGSSSKWSPYFNVLPAGFDTLMYWSDSQLADLRGSAVVNKIGKSGADDRFLHSIVPVIRKHEDLFKCSDLNDGAIIELSHRMGSTIMAYAFDLEPAEKDDTNAIQRQEGDGWEEDQDDETTTKGMVPMADMLNADANLNNAKLFYEEDRVVMRSIQPIAKGGEIYNDYGPLPRADLLRRYGYVTERYAIYDVVEVSQDLITSTAKEVSNLSPQDAQQRVEYLDEHGVLDDAYDISRLTSEDGQFTDELCVLLNALTVPEAAFQKLKTKDKLPKQDLSPESLELLRNVVLRRRAAYGTNSIEQDFLELNAMPETVDDHGLARRRMALQVIIGEKQVLQEAFDSLCSKLNQNTTKRKASDLEGEALMLAQDVKKRKA